MRAAAGHINVARSIFEHPMFDDGRPLSPREAWLWLIANAAWRPVQVMVRNGRSQQLVSLERGQLTYSRSFLRRAWRWTSDKTVRTFLARLRQEGMIDLQTGQLQTVISVCKYDAFQHGGPLAGPSNGQAMGQQRAGNGPEEENIISIKEKKMLPPSSPAGFDDWYSTYPKKKQRQAAMRAFAKVIGSGLIALPVLIEKTKAFAASWENKPAAERKFIPYPASWLNAGGYDDEPEGDGGEPAPVARDPRSFTDGDWQKRLTYFQDSQTWLGAWGARPGVPGCLVPAHLLLSPVSMSKGAA
jgi:hypothetical protein